MARYFHWVKIPSHAAKVAEVRFMMKPNAPGKDFSCEALSLLKDYVLEELMLNKLTATCSVHNVGSYKLLDKCGFEREGAYVKIR